jgi:hypothetical protein
MKISTIYPRDIIALVVLLGCGFLIYCGKDGIITAISTLIIGYYFSKRVYEEKQEEDNYVDIPLNPIPCELPPK